MPTLLLSSEIPERTQIFDLDIVVENGRSTVVCAADHAGVWSWDPFGDAWTHHWLKNPADPDDSDMEMFAVAAAVVDGRLLVGGGGHHQDFTVWDLGTGQVRYHAAAPTSGVQSALWARWGRGQSAPMFIAGDSSVPARVKVFDSPDEDPVELHGHFEMVNALAAGTLGDTPVLLSASDEVIVWHATERRQLMAMDFEGSAVGLVTLDGAERVVAVTDRGDGNAEVNIGDPASGRLIEELSTYDEDADDDVEIDNEVTSGYVGELRGRPIAVAGMQDGTLCVWDLQERRIGEPWQAEDGDVHAIDVLEYDGREVLITAGQEGALKLWDI